MKVNQINKKYLCIIAIIGVSIHQLCSNNQNFNLKKIAHIFHESSSNQIPHASTTNIKSIIFDMDGVLCQTNKLQAFYEIGLIPTLNFIYDQQKLPSEKILFDTLTGVPAQSTYKSYTKGLLMPQIMIDWQTNTQSIASMHNAITTYLKTADFPESQKNWVLHSALMMITPEKFINTRQTIPANIALLHQLKDCAYQLYVLSNWDSNSFSLFQSKFPEIFMYNNKPIFDGIMISGNVGKVKPELEIFNVCLEKFDLQAQSAIFIDDEPANIAAANSIGIHSILANATDCNNLRNNLIALLKHQSKTL